MKLLHMYHDIMNLYGDYANILAVQRILEKSGEEVTVDRLTIGDQVVFSDYDFIFIGSGTEKNMIVVNADFAKYRDQLREYIASDKPILMTGNSFEMLGRHIVDRNDDTYMCMELYDFTAREIRGKRFTSDIICTADFLDEPLVGFINKSTMLEGIKNPLFKIRFGIGNNDAESVEGITDHHFYGTHITGPILEKNPHFLIYMAKLILGREPSTDHLTYERKGYENTLKKLSERI